MGTPDPVRRSPNDSRPLLALAVATVFGVGYAPVAPGTFGSAAGLLVWWLLPASAAVQAVAIVAIFVAGWWGGNVAERHFGRTDPGQVVIDEVMGMLMTLFMNPVHGLHGLHGLPGLVGWKGAAAGFVLFRVFDVIKPYPANKLEQLHGGLGIMADDAMAAVYANLVLRAALVLGNRVIW